MDLSNLNPISAAYLMTNRAYSTDFNPGEIQEGMILCRRHDSMPHFHTELVSIKGVLPKDPTGKVGVFAGSNQNIVVFYSMTIARLQPLH